MSRILIPLIILGSIILAGCTGQPPEDEPASSPTGSKIDNPASVNCEQKGGKLEIRTAADGSQAGYCIFPDGSECEEWAFLRGDCLPGASKAAPQSERSTPIPENTPEPVVGGPAIANPASTYCIEHGGNLELRTAEDGSQAGYCVFPDGSECEEWSYFRGDCAPDDITSIFTNLIADLLEKPDSYEDQSISIIGYYRGPDLLKEAGSPPPISPDDWIIKDNSGLVYAAHSDNVEFPFDIKGENVTGKVIKLTGIVKLSDSGSPYILPGSVEEIRIP